MNAKQRPQQKRMDIMVVSGSVCINENTHEISPNKENTSQTGSNWLIHAHSGLISSFCANVHTPSHKSLLSGCRHPKKCRVIPPTYRAVGSIWHLFPNFRHWWVMQWCNSCKLPPFWASWWSSWSSCSAGFDRWRRCSRRSKTARLAERTVGGSRLGTANSHRKRIKHFKAWNHSSIQNFHSDWSIPHDDCHQNCHNTNCEHEKIAKFCQVAQGSPLALLRSWRLEDSQAVNVSKFDPFLNIWQQKTSILCWFFIYFLGGLVNVNAKFLAKVGALTKSVK